MHPYSILQQAFEFSNEYLTLLPERRVFPSPPEVDSLSALSFPLPDSATREEKVLSDLHEIGSPATVATNGARYFGFVFGGTLPAALAANWLAGAWDQNVVYRLSSPVGAQLEKTAGQWLLSVLSLPAKSAVGFVTGTTMANFSAVLAARHAIWMRQGWNCKEKGVYGAPPMRVVVGDEVHASMLKALVMAGFGTSQLERVPVDNQGRMLAEALPSLDSNTLLCAQAGNVNTGAIDPLSKIAEEANRAGAWMHVDSAFGLWARATPMKAPLAVGCELADSWAVDLHKWLNLPYDSGLIICKEPKYLHEAMSVTAPYLPDDAHAEPCFYTPELSRRARGADAWAALYSLGRSGLATMIERCCELATLFAKLLDAAGFHIINEVVLNQVLVSFGTAEQTNRIIKKIQEDGTCWCGGTVWQGKTAMRISVCSWMTREDDIRVSAETIIRIATTELRS